MKNVNQGCFLSSAEVFSWLDQFINLERGQSPKSFSLQRMKILCELAGNPERCAPSIHIAGSKGKGSITVITSAILEAAGYRVARYMSPHIIDIRERICIGSVFFDDSVYCSAGNELREIVETRLPGINCELFNPDCENGEKPTFFELLTLLFFLCARFSACDIMVIETGMGGRLDCTNVVDPLVSIISLIELEHVKYLGNTIAAIAGEKAGIIKQGKPLVLARQKDEALEVFKKTAAERQSSLTYFPQAAKIDELKIDKNGTNFVLSLEGCPPMRLYIPVPGTVQAENAALSIIAIKTVLPDIKEAAFRTGLENFRIPARFELALKAPPLIIDGAHTPESIALCCETFCSLYGTGNILIFSCATDKNVQLMAQHLIPHFSNVIITSQGTFKVSDPDKIFAVFGELAGKQDKGAKIHLIKDTGAALKQAVEWSKKENLSILCTGSFYLASEIRALI